MKLFLSIVILVATTLFLTSCDTPAEKAASTPAANTASPASGNTEQEVAQLERDWSAAISKQDAEALGKLMAEDGVFVSRATGFHTKAENVENLKKEFEKYKKDGQTNLETVDEVKVKVMGENAVAYGRGTSKETKGGKTETEQFLFTDTAVKRNGRWQFLAMTTTVIKPEAKPQIASSPTEKKK
jgi:uncharacterized protein (TIGR02246 family)